jgi:prevent-host-death family protein
MPHTNLGTEVGSFEAKTKLPELLRGVQRGRRYTITLRGKPIADLVPSTVSQNTEVTAGVARMQQLMASAPSNPGINTKSLIEEGRD